MKYDNLLAEACFVAGNVAKMIREALEGEKHGLIIGAWNLLEADLEDRKAEKVWPEGWKAKEKNEIIKEWPEFKAFASLRSNLSREAKKLYDHGLVVKNNELVAAKSRNKAKKEDSEFLKLAKEVDKAVDAEVKAKLIKLINEALVS